MVHGEKTLMAQFKLTQGCAIPAHDHPHEQTGVVISGRIVLTVDGVDHEAGPGDSWCIGSNVSARGAGGGGCGGGGGVYAGAGGLPRLIRVQGFGGSRGRVKDDSSGA
jgi:hypothetical protein